MSTSEQSIMVVDDAKFSAAVIKRRLQAAGYRDIRVANLAQEALFQLRERPADLLIADWLMPQMDGIELCQKLREVDQQNAHFTYCLLVTGKDTYESLSEAFDAGVDDFVFKVELADQLMPRVLAGLRKSYMVNSLLCQNTDLKQKLIHTESLTVKDLHSGLSNDSQARDVLSRTLKHTDSRGGATSYMTVRVLNWEEICRENKATVQAELSALIAKKLKGLVRPLDEVCKLGQDEYGIIAHFKDAMHCNLGTYRRIFQGLDQQAFKTSNGFINLSVALAICFIDENTTAADLESLCHFNAQQLEKHDGHKPFVVSRWRDSA